MSQTTPPTSASSPSSHEITQLLTQWHAGDAGSEQRLLELLYPVLRSLARRELAVGRMTMRATELVHETYLRLADQSTSFQNRAHFLALFARLLRRVVVDLLRHRSAAKRDRNLLVELQLDEADDTELASSTEVIDWLGLDAALKDLSTRDPIAAQIVELRYFGGMNNDEIAAALDIGPATVGRHWRFARAWLHARLGSADEAR